MSLVIVSLNYQYDDDNDNGDSDDDGDVGSNGGCRSGRGSLLELVKKITQIVSISNKK